MHHCNHRPYPVIMAALQDLSVMLHFFFIPRILFRLDPGPFDGEPVTVEPGFRHQPDILLIAIVVVHRVQRRLVEHGVGHLLLRPVIIIDIISFHLMRRCRRAKHKTFCNFFHFTSPRSRFVLYVPVHYISVFSERLFADSCLCLLFRVNFILKPDLRTKIQENPVVKICKPVYHY